MLRATAAQQMAVARGRAAGQQAEARFESLVLDSKQRVTDNCGRAKRGTKARTPTQNHASQSTCVRGGQVLRLPPQLLPLLVLRSGQGFLQHSPETLGLLCQLLGGHRRLGTARLGFGPLRRQLALYAGSCRLQQLGQHCCVSLRLPAREEGRGEVRDKQGRAER